MVCLIKEAHKEQIEELARTISFSDDKKEDENEAFYQAHKQLYDEIAYHALACNNGKPMYCDPQGNASTLFTQLMSPEYYNGDMRAATIAKLQIYTKQFAQEHGEWIDQYDNDGNLVKEPLVTDLMTSRDIADLKKLFPDKVQDVLDYENDLMSNFVLTEKADLRQIITSQRDLDVAKQMKADKSKIDTEVQQAQDEARAQNPSITNEQLKKIEDRIYMKHSVNKRLEWNRNKIDSVLQDVTKQFSNIWSITESELNNADDIKDDIKRIRVNIINSLNVRKDNPVFMETLSNILVQSIKYGKINETVLNPISEVYVDLMTGTNWFKQVLTLAYGINVNDKKQYKKAVANIKEMLKTAGTEYYKGPNKLEKGWVFFKDLIGTVFSSIIWTIRKVTGTKKQDFVVKLPIMDPKTGKVEIYKSWTTNWFQRTREVNKQILELYKFAALCEDFSHNNNIKFAQTMFSDGDVLHNALMAVSENIEIRKKSIEALPNKDAIGISDYQSLRTLELTLSSALNSPTELKLTRAEEFFQLYIKTATEQLQQAEVLIQRYRNGDETPSLKRLMYIKTDIIGAYDNVLQNVFNKYSQLMTNSPIKSLSDENGVLRAAINEGLIGAMTSAKNEFSSYLNQYIKDYCDQYVDITAGRVLSKEKADLFKTNLTLWLSNTINDGSIGFVEKFITPVRAVNSPIIRLAHNRLSEMNDIVHKESLKLVNDLDMIRAKQRGEWGWGRFDPREFNKQFMETLEDGTLSANLLSDINYGQYEHDFKVEKQRLRDELGIYKDVATGSYIYPGNTDKERDDCWKNYQIGMFMWMGNLEKVVDDRGNVTYRQKGRPRVHRRYKAQYYIDRVSILGRVAYERVQDLNKSIQELLEPFSEDVTYIDPKTKQEITRTVPMYHKLDPFSRQRLDQLMTEKQMLSASYTFDIDYDGTRTGRVGTIINMVPKNSEDLEIAQKVAMWNEKKKTYYSGSKRKTSNFPLYDAVIAKLQDDIDSKKSALDAANPTDVNYQELNNAYQKALIDRSDFERFNTRTEVNPILYKSLKTERTVEINSTNPNANTKRYVQLVSERNAIINRITLSGPGQIRDLHLIGDAIWSKLLEIDKAIYELETATGKDAIQVKITTKTKEHGKEWKDIFTKEDVMEYQGGTVLNRSFYSYLVDTYGHEEAKKKFKFYIDTSKRSVFRPEAKLGTEKKSIHLRILRQSVPNGSGALNIVRNWARVMHDNVPDSEKSKYETTGGKEDKKYLYIQTPINQFADNESDMIDDDFDGTNRSYYQIDKQTYDNSEKYNKVKNNPYYKELLRLIDYGWENMAGVKRGWRYKLPQRQASTSDMWLRKKSVQDVKKSVTSNFIINNRDDIDVETEEYIKRADNTIVESIPRRWTKPLEDPNTIDSDLVSLVGDFVQESLKYKYRTKLQPLMEALVFQLSGGSWSGSPDAGSSDQVELLKNEISTHLYGREIMGSGVNGRLLNYEKPLVKLSKATRRIMHSRLMGHNMLSVLKNGYDSFWNTIGQAFTGKYVLLRNVLNALKYINPITMFTALPGFSRSGVMNQTQGFMQYNGVVRNIHDQYSKQNKAWFRRWASEASSIEFAPIDYTSKAIATEAVYDTFRLMRNPITNKLEFLNEQEAETAFIESGKTRQQGYQAWCDSTPLRQAYKFNYETEYEDKEGNRSSFKHRTSGVIDFADSMTYTDENGVVGATLTRDQIIDIIRPKIREDLALTDDSRSTILETKVRNTINQISQTVNGMLNSEDKPKLAKHWLGAIFTSFRGWMITQGSEFYRDGQDFYNFDKDVDIAKSMKQYMDGTMNSTNIISANLRKRVGVLEDSNFKGQYDFATGTVSRGIHRVNVWRLLSNFHNFLMIAIEPFYMAARDSAHFIKKHTVGESGNKEYKNGKAYWIEDRHLTLDEVYAFRNLAASMWALGITTYLAVLAAGWYDDGNDEQSGTRALVYAGLVASMSERFSQIPVGFLTNIAELVNSVTVATSLVQPIVYTAQTVFSLWRQIGQITDESGNTFDIIKQGTYKGRSKGDRMLTEGLTFVSNVMGMDLLPYELMYDAGAAIGAYDSSFNARDYNVNWYKSYNKNANEARAKWYSNVSATPFINWAVTHSFGEEYDLIPKKSKKKSGISIPRL